jgi:hypothetical protein
MSWRTILFGGVVVAICYSVVPLVTAAAPSGMCCSIDNTCPLGLECVEKLSDCSLTDVGHCVPVPVG